MNYADVAIVIVLIFLAGMVSAFAFGDKLVKHKH